MLPYYGDLAGRVDVRVLQTTQLHGFALDILETIAPQGQRVWLVACPEMFGRAGNPYVGPDGRDWPDNAERFALFAAAIAWLGTARVDPHFRADIVHLNDWHTALAAALSSRSPDRPGSVFSIHNLSYQGIFDYATFVRIGLPAHLWSMQGLEFHGSMSFIKAGIAFADRITTVSPTCAREIQTAEYGCGLDGLIRHRAGDLRGILNGVDTTLWNPATDRFLDAHYTSSELAGKLHRQARHSKIVGAYGERRSATRRRESSCAAEGHRPDTCGDRRFGRAARAARGARYRRCRDRIGVARLPPDETGRVAFAPRLDEALAHQIEAGADIFLMPSRFEPCGLNQMYSQIYGTVPVVRRTGGRWSTRLYRSTGAAVPVSCSTPRRRKRCSTPPGEP